MDLDSDLHSRRRGVAADASRRLIGALAAAAALLAFGGCASLNSVDSEVTAYSKWPTGRTPATYAFERLPSQQSRPQQSQVLEDAARQAVEGAGFAPAAGGTTPDVTVQLGARVTEFDRSPFDDPFWYGSVGPFHRPFFHGRYGRSSWGPGWRYGYWGPAWDSSYFEREVVILIRDRKTGEPLYETRASSNGSSSEVARLLPAMYGAAMKDFPQAVSNVSHRVPLDPVAAN